MRPSAPIEQVVDAGGRVVDEDLDRIAGTGIDAGDLLPEMHVRSGALGVIEQDPCEFGARHPHCRRVVGTAGLHVGQVRDDRCFRSGGAEVESLERVAGRADVVPGTERIEDAQGVALERDAGAERAQLGLGLENVDFDAALGELDGGGESSDATAGDRDLLHCGHVRTSLFSGFSRRQRIGDGVDGRPDRAGDRQRRGGKEEVVPAGCRAHDAQLLEIPHLADREAEVRDHHLVQRLERGGVELVGAHFEAPRVGGDRGDLGAVQPAGRREREAGRGAAGVVAPAVAPGAGELTRAHEHDVAAADRGG